MDDEGERVTYSAVGSVRGSCAHAHRTPRAALECARRDNRECAQVGGYSDRRVVAFNADGVQSELHTRIARETLLSEEDRR